MAAAKVQNQNFGLCHDSFEDNALEKTSYHFIKTKIFFWKVSKPVSNEQQW